MKKVFLSAVAIAVVFVAFAFTPSEKNNLLDDAQVLSELEVARETGTCDTKYRVQETFSECDRVHTDPVIIKDKAEIIGGY